MESEALRSKLADFAGRLRAMTAEVESFLAALGYEAVQVAAAKTPPCPAEEIVREWNKRCGTVGMQKRNAVGALRQKIIARWKQHPHLDRWRAAMDACARNDWWRGTRGEWVGSLESFLSVAHFDKFVDEGLGVAAPAPAGLFENHDDEGAKLESVEEFLERFLKDRSVELPAGYGGADPRPCAAVAPDEYGKRLADLHRWLEEDWRFR